MADWGSYIDREIRKALEKGDFANLSGEGKPLNMEDDAYTPPDKRLAYKILRDNDLAPEWIMMGKDVEAAKESLVKKAARAIQVYREALAGARPGAVDNWLRAQKRLAAEADKLNREINTYNLKVPPGILHKPFINIQREIDRLLAGG
jgi:hypothetical protein